MTYKVLFLDIDGTILKSDHSYTELTKQAIRDVKKQGVDVFLATGRPLHEIDQLADELDVHSYIGYNGAFAVHQNQTILNETMDHNVVKKILDIANEHNHELVLYTRSRNYFTTLTRPIVTNFINTFQLKKNEMLTPDVMDQILGATVMNLDASQPSLYELDANINLSPVNIPGVEGSFDIIRETVNKGLAVEKVFNLLNIKRDEAIAFGDGMNDKEMLKMVGNGFAMGNAHPDLFEYAKHRTSTVTDDGIFNGLKQLGLVK